MEATKDYELFSPSKYLTEFYSNISDDAEELFLSNFFHQSYDLVPEGSSMVEIGGGPTIYQLIGASRKAKSIVFSDYKEENLREVRKWVMQESDAFDWDSYFRVVLGVEGTAITPDSLAAIKKRLRKSVKEFVRCDIFNNDPLAPFQHDQFDVVSTSFCPESITDNETDFTKAMINLFSLLKKGGRLVAVMLRNASFYTVNGVRFSSFVIDEKFIEQFLEKHGFTRITVSSIPIQYKDEGFDGLMGITAVKS